MQVVMGIDPGAANLGFGIVRVEGNRMVALDGGVVEQGKAAEHLDALDSSPGVDLSLEDHDALNPGGLGDQGVDPRRIEVGHDDLGNKYSVAGSLGGTPYNATYKMDNWYVAATGTLPLQVGFSLLGKLGISANKVSGGQICAGGSCASFAADDSKTDVMVGIGAQYAFMKNWAARLEYENYGKMSGDDIWGTGGSGALKADAWNISVNYAF